MQTICRWAVLLLLVAAQGWAASKTALDRYVEAPDPNYKYEKAGTIQGEGYTAYVLDMTSQSWRSPEEVDRTLWKHWVTIIRPNEVKHETGLLYITAGNNNSPAPQKVEARLAALAVDTGTVVTELRMVPNQPLTFAGETRQRVEDELIAYTWDKYLRGGDANWLARLPMTKSAVRAMDTITSFCAGAGGGNTRVTRFVVAGGSKRGWTTWTTAAVDKRVVAIVPIVIDLLNVSPSFEHHWRVYGFWAPAIKDYEDMNIMNRSRTPRYREMMQIVEPFSYRDRLTLPKLMLNATGDQFFLPDSSKFYFNELRGEKHLRYVPNADHSLRNSDAFETLHAFYAAVVNGRERPKLDWSVGKDGTIRVKPDVRPAAVKLWQATNTSARDFRLQTIGPAWRSTDLQPDADGSYHARVEAPAKGWTAYLVEATLPSGGKYPFKFTTGVQVIPDRVPFPPFQPAR